MGTHAIPLSYWEFQCKFLPTISIMEYLLRFATYAWISNEGMIMGIIYLCRLSISNPNFAVNQLTIHRLLLVSMLAAAKFYDDQYASNACYAILGGVTTRELNRLEAHFLFLINFQLYISPEQYSAEFRGTIPLLRSRAIANSLLVYVYRPRTQQCKDCHRGVITISRRSFTSQCQNHLVMEKCLRSSSFPVSFVRHYVGKQTVFIIVIRWHPRDIRRNKTIYSRNKCLFRIN